ncbi:apolipoprotein N-acyltransferase [Armatimonadetes bacterium GXS]|nr:apolipoprotein N-acyltransferase [Armatimonadetes bacterium GXS]
MRSAIGLLLSGGVLSLAFLPGDWWLLLGVPAVSFRLLSGRGWQGGLLGGWLWGFSFYFVQGYWALPVFEQRAASPLYAGIAWALAALWASGFHAAFGLVINLKPASGWFWDALVVASAWTVCQWLRSLGTFGFPWAMWSAALAQQSFLIQPADIGAVWLLEWGLAFWNALLGQILASFRSSEIWRLAQISGVLLLIAVGWCGYSLWRMSQNSQLDRSERIVRVGVLQYPRPVRPETERQELDEICMRARSEGVAWLILPESMAHFVPESTDGQQWHERARKFGGSILLGASRRYDSRWRTNSACVLASEQELVCRDKVKLMPFTEARLSWSVFGLLPALGLREPQAIRAGDQLQVLVGKDGTRVGALICSESLYSWLARGMVLEGAEWLAVMSNDSWLPSEVVRYQFAQYCALRAVECRRWVVRASPNGFSGVWTPAGVWSGPPLDRLAFWVSAISTRTDRTLAVRGGDWVVYLALGVVASGSLYPVWKQRKGAVSK